MPERQRAGGWMSARISRLIVLITGHLVQSILSSLKCWYMTKQLDNGCGLNVRDRFRWQVQLVLVDSMGFRQSPANPFAN